MTIFIPSTKSLLNDWEKFLDGRDPSPRLVLEFLETGPTSGWGDAINWLLLDHEYRIVNMQEQIDWLYEQIGSEE